MAVDHFAGPVAEHYDESSAAMSAPAVVDPAVDLLALPLSARGAPVRGIDLSPDMLARLRAEPIAERIGVTVGDFATTRVEGTSALVHLVVNTVMDLTSQDEQVARFADAARHLAPGGHVVVEVGVPDLQRLPPGERARPFSVSADRLGVDEYDVGEQRLVSHHWTLTGGRPEARSIPFRYVWPAELDLMARLAGLRPAGRWADWHRRPFTSDSRTHVSAWRKPGEGPEEPRVSRAAR
ncbi:methyltransferase domain-containing protein [Geodermatophilus nigrescens]